MDCQQCGAPNQAGSRFCDQCGAGLASTCTTCGQPNRPGARFCGSCGTALATSEASASDRPPDRLPDRPAASSERRLVSVLFADLVGFTPFAEERDPEETRELLSRYYDTTRLVIERHGGTVEKFIGDAVMAAWGTPVAHEDDAERAVRAALGIVDAVRGLGHGLDARVGVLTGEAAVTLGAANQGMVAGDLVNTAARLQGVAPEGAVLVGEATMRAASAAIAFEPAGEQQLKGKQAPVPAWRALRVVAERGGQGRTEGLEPPFVGRDEELRLLKDLLHTTGRDRRVRLVSISGPAGIGKSRLAWELEKYVDGLVEDVFWHRGRSPAYGEGITFWALGEMVRRRAGLVEADDDATSRQRLAAMVAEFVPDEADRRWVEPAVRTLLGLEPPPAGGRDLLYAAWRILFERIAERGTTVLLFEDLHWADTGLLEFVEHLATVAKGVPIVVLTLARPELFDRRPDWGAGIRNLTTIALEPLPEPVMLTLLDGLVSDLPTAAARAILERAEGIPLYAVETIRGLLADGRLERAGDGTIRPTGDLGRLTVPESLRSLVAARLDGLDPVDRALLLDGAVLGQTFGIPALAAVSGAAEAELEARLRDLVRRELLVRETDPRSPERGQYGFVQGIVREVAYSTLSKRDRRARHLAVARHFEALGDPELAGALASHYLAAHEASTPGPEADAVAAQARISLRAAADRAADLGANDQALVYLDQALSVTIEPAEQAALLERTALLSPAAGRFQAGLDAGTAAIAIYRELGDQEAVARASGIHSANLIEAGQLVLATTTLEQAISDLPADGMRAIRADLEAKRSRAYMRGSRHDDAIAAADRALAIAEPDDLEDVVAEALLNKGSTLGGVLRWREGASLIQTALEIAERSGDVAVELRAVNNLASTIWGADPERSWAMQHAGHELGRRLGHRAHTIWMAMILAYSAYDLGRDWDAAIARLDEEFDGAKESDRARLLGAKAQFLIDRGGSVAALVAEIRQLVADASDPDMLATIPALDAQLDAVRGDFAGAVTGFIEAADLAAQSAGLLLLEVGLNAGMGHDLAGVRLAAERMESPAESGHGVAALPRLLRAAEAALTGRPEAADAFEKVFAELAALAYVRARGELLAVRLLPDAPHASRWAADARVVFVRCRTELYLRMLDEAVTRIPAHRSPADRTPVGENQAASVSQPVR